MFKKLLVLAAGAVFSLNASAGYVAYDLSGGVTGKIIQNDVTNRIVNFQLDLLIPDAPSSSLYQLSFASNHRGDGMATLGSESTRFQDGGPTNFSIRSDFGGDQRSSFNISFVGGPNGTFSYTGGYQASIYFIGGFQDFSGRFEGTAQSGAVNPAEAELLEKENGINGSNVIYIPASNDVPEPASLALLGIGALGALSMARRRKRSH